MTKKKFILSAFVVIVVVVAAIFSVTYLQVRDAQEASEELAKIDCDKLKCMDLAKQGHVEAQFKLAEELSFEDDGDLKALEWYEKAAKQGHVEAQYRLAEIYFFGGNGVAADGKKTLALHQELAESGYVDSQYALGQLYKHGSFGTIPIDHQAAFKWHQMAAENGDSWSSQELAVMYFTGRGVEKDYFAAIGWYRQYIVMETLDTYWSLETGMLLILMAALFILAIEKPKLVLGTSVSLAVLAIVTLGATYMQIKDIYKPPVYTIDADGAYFYGQPCKESAEKCLSLAEEGDANAQYWLGSEDRRGRGKGALAGFKWWGKAAEQGHVEAQHDLSQIYLAGEEGVPQDTEKALEMLTKLAESGHIRSQSLLGDIYSDGFFSDDTVPIDHETAFKWHLMAAENGDVWAAEDVSDMYFHGVGIEKNFYKGVSWYRTVLVLKMLN